MVTAGHANLGNGSQINRATEKSHTQTTTGEKKKKNRAHFPDNKTNNVSFFPQGAIDEKPQSITQCTIIIQCLLNVCASFY